MTVYLQAILIPSDIYQPARIIISKKNTIVRIFDTVNGTMNADFNCLCSYMMNLTRDKKASNIVFRE